MKTSKRKYNRASRFFKRQIARARSKHIAKIGEKLESYPSGTHQFWALSKAALGNFSQPSLPPLRTGNDILVHTAKEKADLLSGIFASNSTLGDQGTTPPTILRCHSSMPEVKFNQSAVRRALSSLDIHKPSGPDGISLLVLRYCAPELTPVLTRLFRHSYSVGVVPRSYPERRWFR